MSAWIQEKSGEVVDVTQVKAGEATKMASETGQSIQDRAVEAKDQTGSFLGEKSEAVTKAASETTEAAKKTATDTADAAHEKSAEAAKHVQDTAGEYTKDTPVAPKENIFQQAGGNVVGAATDAKDAVMNTLGMGGDK